VALDRFGTWIAVIEELTGGVRGGDPGSVRTMGDRAYGQIASSRPLRLIG